MSAWIANRNLLCETMVQFEFTQEEGVPFIYRTYRLAHITITSARAKKWYRTHDGPAKTRLYYFVITSLEKIETLLNRVVNNCSNPIKVLQGKESEIDVGPLITARAHRDEFISKLEKIFEETEVVPNTPIAQAQETKAAKKRAADAAAATAAITPDAKRIKKEEEKKRKEEERQRKLDEKFANMDKSGIIRYEGPKNMPFPPRADDALLLCIPNTRDDKLCKRGKKCKFVHNNKWSTWNAATCKQWVEHVDNTVGMSWVDGVDVEMLRKKAKEA